MVRFPRSSRASRRPTTRSGSSRAGRRPPGRAAARPAARRPSATSPSTRRSHRRAGSYRLHTNLPGGSEQRPPRSSACRSPPEPPVKQRLRLVRRRITAAVARDVRRRVAGRRRAGQGRRDERRRDEPVADDGPPSQSDDGAGATQSGGESQSDGFGPTAERRRTSSRRRGSRRVRRATTARAAAPTPAPARAAASRAAPSPPGSHEGARAHRRGVRRARRPARRRAATRRWRSRWPRPCCGACTPRSRASIRARSCAASTTMRGRRVPASALVRRLAAAVPYAGALSGGLVDATVEPTFAPERTAPTGDPRPARPDPQRRWAQVSVDGRRSRARPAWRSTAAGSARASPPTSSPTGCAALPSYAIECMGDVRAGRRRARPAGREPLGRRGPGRATPDRRRGRHERRHAPRLAPDRPEHRTARPHGHRPGHGARAHRARGRGPRQGRAARAARRRRAITSPTAACSSSTTARSSRYDTRLDDEPGRRARRADDLEPRDQLRPAHGPEDPGAAPPRARAAGRPPGAGQRDLRPDRRPRRLAAARPGAAPRPGRAARPLRRALPPAGHRPRADRRLWHVRAGRDVLRPPARRHPALALGAPLAAPLLAARRRARPASGNRRDDDVGARRARAARGRGRGAGGDARS